MSTCHTNKNLYVSCRSSNHINLQCFWITLIGTMVLGNTGSYNYFANKGTCAHNWIIMVKPLENPTGQIYKQLGQRKPSFGIKYYCKDLLNTQVKN